jgi:hypothetical protein
MEILQKKSGIKRSLYVIERLPQGIEECRFINPLLRKATLNLFPLFLQKKRNCYRIDEEQMNVEITRGRSIFMIF